MNTASDQAPAANKTVDRGADVGVSPRRGSIR